ncbi:MAG: hypothetical protein KAT33_08610, partial [Bacteroidales bacterium]|nr:hypothetical protein [Bacteroidales bacterium]
NNNIEYLTSNHSEICYFPVEMFSFFKFHPNEINKIHRVNRAGVAFTWQASNIKYLFTKIQKI